tara:strand:- start:568 stop:801 length:234 start_codon:yes stop_codon:yes gene_type:complete
MVLKTFNVEEKTYKKFSKFCKEEGISMSKQVDFFMQFVIEKEPKVRQAYLEKLKRLREQATVHIGGLNDFKKRYGVE